MSTVSIKHNQTASLTLARFCGIAFGIGTQLLFLWTVVQQFLFLRYGGAQSYKNGLFFDCLLSIGFALPHSLLLAPPVQKRIKSGIPNGLLGCSIVCISPAWDTKRV